MVREVFCCRDVLRKLFWRSRVSFTLTRLAGAPKVWKHTVHKVLIFGKAVKNKKTKDGPWSIVTCVCARTHECNGLAVGWQVTQGSARERARRHLGSCPPDFHVTKVKINAREDKKQRESQAANFKGDFCFICWTLNQPANWGRRACLDVGEVRMFRGRALFWPPPPLHYTSRLLCAKVYEEDSVDFYTLMFALCGYLNNVQILNRK